MRADSRTPGADSMVASSTGYSVEIFSGADCKLFEKLQHKGVGAVKGISHAGEWISQSNAVKQEEEQSWGWT